MNWIHLSTMALAGLLGMSTAQAQMGGGGNKAEAERAVQNYLSMWSSNADVTAAAVQRFYAPRVIYYGRVFSRAAVLADKRAYIRSWPVRSYREVPGSFAAQCNSDRSLCHVSADMTWRRINRRNVVSTGRARIGFDFVPVEGTRKIARESARLLRTSRN